MNGICGASATPLGRTPSVNARLKSSALHLPMPVSGSGEILVPLTRYRGVSQVCGHARIGCETAPSSNGSRRTGSPNACLLALGRCEGFDVACLCHLVRKLCP